MTYIDLSQFGALLTETKTSCDDEQCEVCQTVTASSTYSSQPSALDAPIQLDQESL
jgi:hypothetical protein